MFRQLAFDLGNNPGAAEVVFQFTPVQLLAYLEEFWSRPRSNQRYLGDAADVQGQIGMATPRPIPGAPPNLPAINVPVVWQHLIYAYALENTRIVEVLKRVVEECAYDEAFGRPEWPVQRWLRNAEELLFTATTPSWVFSPASGIRPDPGAIRRNAYYRMFGSDLSHGLDGVNRPYPYRKAEAKNGSFASVFGAFLQEVWQGYVNRLNMVGPNQSDDAAIARHAEQLSNMLRVRRIQGALSREEFYAGGVLSFCHLTVQFNSLVVRFLKAEADNEGDRLRKIGERVGLPAHAMSYHYFEMAEPLSRLVSMIELELFNQPANARALYDDTVPGLTDDVVRVVTNWGAVTGISFKRPERVVLAPGASLAAVALPPNRVPHTTVLESAT